MKKLVILGIGAGVASFDEVDTQLIQFLSNIKLINHGERNALFLRSIP
ncbi:hypothetical protein ES703_81348 [subsurface metagenome]